MGNPRKLFMASNSTVSASRGPAPARGLQGLKQNWKFDLLAGFTVSLIALPLCLGIAKASEFPPIAGLFTAIVGGLFASRIAGSNVTISGPAAGLIVVNVAAVASLGGIEKGPAGYALGYPYALAAILVGGLLVMLFGMLKVGKLGDFFPSAAVHGMLAAIGIIIIVKQIFDAMGIKAKSGGELYELVLQIPEGIGHAVPQVLAIAGISLAILVGYPFIKNRYLRLIPAPMWVLLVTVPVGYFAFHLGDIASVFKIGEAAPVAGRVLVDLPKNAADGIVLPDFGKVGTGAFWIAVTTIALVSGLESLLSAKAVDALDPWKRKSELNRDLLAMGGASALAAAVGGLPMISEIVRSSANINNGGRTQWANFFHGAFLLTFLLLLAPVINLIPVAALAGMLIFTGFRLASPKEFKHMYQIAWTQLLVFVVTIVVVLAVDLLVGIAAGIVAELVVNLASGAQLRSLFVAHAETRQQGETTILQLRGTLTFTNYLSLKSKMNKAMGSKEIVLDMSEVTFIDHTVMANLTNLQGELRMQEKSLKIEGLNQLTPVSGHALAPRRKLVNPTLLPANLSSRQLEVMVYALNGKNDYLPQSWDDLDSWSVFSSTLGLQIRSESCVIRKKGQGFNITCADLTIASGALLTYESSSSTRLRIDFTQHVMPRFLLTQESTLDKVAERLGAQDIDFEEFPRFSDLFLLQGEDEAGIRSYFNTDILQFHESHPHYSMESSGSSVMIYGDLRLASTDEIGQMMAYAMEYCALVLPAATMPQGKSEVNKTPSMIQ